MKKAHKLHPRAAGPFSVQRIVNPNAYDVEIPPEWGISSTFNFGDLVAYRGPLGIPPEPRLSPYSTESSLSTPAENDGDHSPGDIAFNGPDPVTEHEAPGEDEAVKERKGRPRRPTKSTFKLSEYFYF